MSRTTETATGRSPAQIEDDIRSIRARMDQTLDEIEYRLSPGQLGGGVADFVRDVVQGNPNRLARAVRDNPLPVALIGIGALWLAWAVSRTTDEAVQGRRVPPHDAAVTDQRTLSLLGGLLAVTRRGAEVTRQVEAAINDRLLAPALTQVHSQLARSAAVIEEELIRRGSPPTATTDTAPMHPAWYGLEQALTDMVSRDRILVELERGVNATLDLYHDSLHAPLSDDLRVVLGAQFHDIETTHHRIGALRSVAA